MTEYQWHRGVGGVSSLHEIVERDNYRGKHKLGPSITGTEYDRILSENPKLTRTVSDESLFNHFDAMNKQSNLAHYLEQTAYQFKLPIWHVRRIYKNYERVLEKKSMITGRAEKESTFLNDLQAGKTIDLQDMKRYRNRKRARKVKKVKRRKCKCGVR